MRFARFIPLLFLLGCLDDPDCLVTASNLVKIDFKNADGSARTMNFGSISVSGLSTPFYAGASLASIQLPVNPSATETTYTIREATNVRTVKIRYAITHRTISEKCGVFAYYTNLEVVENTFTSSKIKSPFLVTNVTSNVEIFY